MVERRDEFPDTCSVHVMEYGNLSFVVVRGEVDLQSASLLAGELATLVDRRHTIVVDLRTVSFFGAAGINVLLEAYGRAINRNVAIHVIATRQGIVKPLHITGMDHIFGVHTTLHGALRAATLAPGKGQLRREG
jgi:anti-sigma B factor antagonist